MIIHSVYFWLKPDLTAAQRTRFARGIADLAVIPSVSHGWVGRPSSTDRAVIDRSYHHGLTTVFVDMAAHDAYQQHPVHLEFLNDCRTFWERVVIYDADTER